MVTQLDYSAEHKLLYVVKIEKDKEVIHIASSRKTTPSKWIKYEEGI